MSLQNRIFRFGSDRDCVAEMSFDVWEVLLRGAIVFGLGLVAYLSISGDIFQSLYHGAEKIRWSRLITRPSILWASVGSLLIFFRTSLWFSYRPIRPVDLQDAPFLSVIIPAYNEGSMVAKTIQSVVNARYPRDRIEIIVVDDGSTDDTWQHIQHASACFGGLVTPVRFPRNEGKRAALTEGFQRARGEVVVTIDSDSIIGPETLLAMAGPFRDPRVGAVAGKVDVYNRQDGVIPRMLKVRYVLSFDFLRAAQSSYGTVYCCPGALSAYRMAAVREVMEEWVNQTFMGVRCTYGEDRSLTNYLLSRGYDTVYQRNAVVHTVVPRTYGKLCKMFLRWDRSYIREELRFAKIVWKRQTGPRLIALFDFVVRNIRYPVGYASLLLLLLLASKDPLVILRLLFVIGFMSALNMLYYLRSERSWDFVYGIFYAYFSFFTLFWIFPYAFFTLRSRSWMTR
jgi:hyaluronan synthase